MAVIGMKAPRWRLETGDTYHKASIPYAQGKKYPGPKRELASLDRRYNCLRLSRPVFADYNRNRCEDCEDCETSLHHVTPLAELSVANVIHDTVPNEDEPSLQNSLTSGLGSITESLQNHHGSDSSTKSDLTVSVDTERRRSPPLESSLQHSPKSPQAGTIDVRVDVGSPLPQSRPDAEPLEEGADCDDHPSKRASALLEEVQEEGNYDAPFSVIVRDLETRAITTTQLTQEVQDIYAGLSMVERKCMTIVNNQLESQVELSDEQWQALVALHRTLLNEHHDFFSASHHPVTKGHELREWATRYDMPARMWRHGTHGFLELLRRKLPQSREFMICFLYLVYPMMASLKETVPEFLEIWVECLGDIARYRMSIEEAGTWDREVWSNTARTWFNQAADLSPTTGRIHHHLAVLARPHIVQQLFLYSKALVAAVPFEKAAESILLLFTSTTDPNDSSSNRPDPADLHFVSAAAVLFRRRGMNDFIGHWTQFASTFSNHIRTATIRFEVRPKDEVRPRFKVPHELKIQSKFKVHGAEYAGALFAMLADFGREDNAFWKMITDHQQELERIYVTSHQDDSEESPKDLVVSDLAITKPLRVGYWRLVASETPVSRVPSLPSPVLLSDSTVDTQILPDDVSAYVRHVMLQTIADVTEEVGNQNVVPFMHMLLAYLYALTWIPGASVYVEACIPWEGVVKFLNTVSRSAISYDNVEATEFPKSCDGTKKQLPEDFLMRGLLVMTYYYEPDFFKHDDLLDEDERLLEHPSSQPHRVERCLWAAHKLATLNDRWLSYDPDTKLFSTTSLSEGLALGKSTSQKF